MSEPRSLGTVLKAMLLAGLLAGAALAFFHSVLTEPVIDQAIAIEEARPRHLHEPEPVVSRQVQKKGLVVGSLLFGLFIGVIFGGVFYLAQGALPGRSVVSNAVLLALASYWAVALLPFLKYPANPPGVGEAATVEYRQALYVGFLLLSVAGALAAAMAARRSRRAALLGYAAFAVALLLLMPPNPDPVEMPLDLVATFRALSLAGLTVFWLVLGVTFGLLAQWLQRGRPARVTAP